MATFRRWRRERNRQRLLSPDERSIDIKEIKDNYDWKMNRYQKSHWGDIEAKEAHASVVKYMWRKEFDLNNKINDLKKHIANQTDIKSSGNESRNQEVVFKRTNKSINRGFRKHEVEAPLRGIHFRTTEDKTFEKLNLIKSERNLENNMSYIEKVRSKANTEIEDDLSEDLKSIIRGKSAYQISTALLGESERSARRDRLQELEKFRSEQRRSIYDIMAERNKLKISHDDNCEHEPLHQRKWHAQHDYRWNNSDYLNLVGYRMQNDKPCGFMLQNRGEIIW